MDFRFPLCAILALDAISAQSPSFDLTTIPTKATPQSLVVGDFNRDGKPDLAVSGIDGSGNGTVEILLGNGDGSFRSAGVIAVGAHASRIIKADFNNDGKLDLAVSVGDSGQVVVLLGNGDGSFGTPADSGATTPSGQLAATIPGLAAGDINGDGKPDLVIGPYTFTSSCSVAVMLGNGDGTFQRPVSSAMDRVDNPQGVVSDLNGDGKADVFVTGWSSTNGQRYGELLANADGSLTLNWLPYTYPFIFGAWITVQDVNGNGKPDAIAMNLIDYPSPGRFVIAVIPDGRQSNPVVSALSIPIESYHGWSYETLIAADVTGDGHPDLLLNDMYGNLFVLPGNGDGSFETPAAYPSPSPAQTVYTGASPANSDVWGSLATADFRGVGKQDVVMVLAGKSVSLLKNGAGAAPAVSPAGLTNAATLAAVPGVAGSLAAVFGNGFTYDSGTTQGGGNYGFDVVPDSLFGLTLQIDGIAAPLLYASPTQANIQIPWELAGKTQATLLATRNGVTQTITIPLAPYEPGLFSMNGQGTGQAAAIIANANPPAIPAPVGAFSSSRPIHRGEYLSLYGTGLGALQFSGQTNAATRGCCDATTTMPLVTVGGQPATVQFSGMAPTLLGVYQINIPIPDNAPTGNAVPVFLNIGGIPSNTVTIAIQ